MKESLNCAICVLLALVMKNRWITSINCELALTSSLLIVCNTKNVAQQIRHYLLQLGVLVEVGPSEGVGKHAHLENARRVQALHATPIHDPPRHVLALVQWTRTLSPNSTG